MSRFLVFYVWIWRTLLGQRARVAWTNKHKTVGMSFWEVQQSKSKRTTRSPQKHKKNLKLENEFSVFHIFKTIITIVSKHKNSDHKKKLKFQVGVGNDSSLVFIIHKNLLA